MPLAKRIIPCLDVDDGKVLKGIKFRELTVVGDPVELAKEYNRQGADELVFLDIGASAKHREIMSDVVYRTSQQVFIPLTVGGGIRTIDDVKMALRSGADKVSMNTAAVKNPEIIRESAERFGSQCTVCAIDAKRVGDSWNVIIRGGRDMTELDAIEWAKEVERLGAGEILLTSWDADGTKEGYDLELTGAIADATHIPVIASGGAGTLEHILDAFTKGKADAALLASLLHYGTFTIKEIKDYLKEKGVVIR